MVWRVRNPTLPDVIWFCPLSTASLRACDAFQTSISLVVLLHTAILLGERADQLTSWIWLEQVI